MPLDVADDYSTQCFGVYQRYFQAGFAQLVLDDVVAFLTTLDIQWDHCTNGQTRAAYHIPL